MEKIKIIEDSDSLSSNKTPIQSRAASPALLNIKTKNHKAKSSNRIKTLLGNDKI